MTTHNFFLATFSLFSFLFSACSTHERWSDVLDKKVQQQSLQLSGRKIVQTKVVLVDEEIQQKFSPHFPGEKTNWVSQKNNFWIGVSMLGREPVSRTDHRFYSQSERCEIVNEISDATQVEMQVPFAFPFYRVFHVACAGQGPLRLETPLGTLDIWSGR